MVSVTLAVQINKTFIGAESDGWVIIYSNCGIAHKKTLNRFFLPLTDLQERQGSGRGSWHSVQDPEALVMQRTDRPGNHDRSYPPGDDR